MQASLEQQEWAPLEKLVSKLRVLGQFGKSHAYARVVIAFFIGDHDGAPSQITGGERDRSLSHQRLDQGRAGDSGTLPQSFLDRAVIIEVLLPTPPYR